jgi:hypothetical protein
LCSKCEGETFGASCTIEEGKRVRKLELSGRLGEPRNILALLSRKSRASCLVDCFVCADDVRYGRTGIMLVVARGSTIHPCLSTLTAMALEEPRQQSLIFIYTFEMNCGNTEVLV